MDCFRKACPADLGRMLELVAGAQAYLKSQGLTQWQNGYPQKSLLIQDIESGAAWVGEQGGQVAAMAALVFGPDPNYATIYEGAWGTQPPYGAVHRVALAPETRGTGLAAALFAALEKTCLENGCRAVRVDTHRGNKPMRRLLEKCGYTLRGVIYLSEDDGPPTDERLAYDKTL